MFTTLTAADGHDFACWMQRAQGEARGNLVILQEIFGVTDQLKGVAAHYAAHGLNVAIPALFDRVERDAVVAFDAPQRGQELMQRADTGQMMADIAATVQAMAAKGGKVAVLGFCRGGGLAIKAALEMEIACAVSFYGTRIPEYLGADQKAPVMAHFGVHDSHTPREVIEQAREALPDMAMFIYDAGHAFANDRRPKSYNPQAAERAHQRSLAFVLQHLAP